MGKTKGEEVELKSKKRKKKSTGNPPKRHKSDYSERFKFVLAPNNSDKSDSDEKEVPRRHHSNLSKIYESPSDSSLYEEDSSWLDEEMESSLLSEEEECSEEWETDTDYSEEGSFHASDCEEISDDSDYVPPIEDKYVKKGEATIYDAKGLEIAFGDTNDSQIIEINDLDIDINDNENPPMLVDENGSEVKATSTPETETEEEEIVIEYSQLLNRVTFYDCKDDQGVVICLNKTIHFMGILEIRPIFNSVQVNGFTIKAGESLKVTSISHANYYLNLSPVVSNDGDLNELKKLLNEKTFEDIMSKVDKEKNSIIHLKRGLPDTTVEFLKASYNILPHKNMILKNSVSSSSELILMTKFFASKENPRLNCFRINEDWKYVEMKSYSKIVVVGGKNTGKSTLAQYLVNHNVSKFGKILLIDLDIGQPICGISQTVSATVIANQPIIGAGYLNSKLKQVKSLLFGDKSITIAPFKYVECVRRLIDFCANDEELNSIPWVINTLGYQKGFGIQLLTVILKIVQPSDIVQIQHTNAKYNFETIVDESFVNKATLSFFEDYHIKGILKEAYFTTHVLSSLVNNHRESLDENSWISNATEKRKMSLLAHLSKLMQIGQTHLTEVVPHRVEIDNVRMMIMDEDEFENANFDSKLDLFNGNLIYLCNDENSILECYGVGLVRAIDKIHRYMYILLPHEMNSNAFQSVNVIAIANIPLPSDVLLRQSLNTVEGSVPFVTFFKNRGAKKYMNKRNIKDCY